MAILSIVYAIMLHDPFLAIVSIHIYESPPSLSSTVARDPWSSPIHGSPNKFVDPVTRLVEENPLVR